jgi:hypothetical protein
MKLPIDSDALAYAFIEPTKEVYKDDFEMFKALHNKADYQGKLVEVVQGERLLQHFGDILDQGALGDEPSMRDLSLNFLHYVP